MTSPLTVPRRVCGGPGSRSARFTFFWHVWHVCACLRRYVSHTCSALGARLCEASRPGLLALNERNTSHRIIQSDRTVSSRLCKRRGGGRQSIMRRANMTRTANKRMQSTPNATPRSAAEQPGEEKEGDVTRTMNLEFSDVRLSIHQQQFSPPPSLISTPPLCV